MHSVWQNIDQGYFESLINGADIALSRREKRRNRRLGRSSTAGGTTYGWVTNTMAHSISRKKSFIGSFLLKYPEVNKTYVMKYLVCEFASMLHVFAQICIMQWIMDGQFTAIGPKLYDYYILGIGKQNPLLATFPSRFLCHLEPLHSEFEGHPGYDTTCSLILNMHNEGVVVLFYFILIGLATTSVLQLAVRLLMTVPIIRHSYLTWRWSDHTDSKLIIGFLGKTEWWEHIIVGAVFSYVDADKFCNILMDRVQERPDPVGRQLEQLRNRIIGRQFLS
jgi:hypothetical protein